MYCHFPNGPVPPSLMFILIVAAIVLTKKSK